MKKMISLKMILMFSVLVSSMILTNNIMAYTRSEIKYNSSDNSAVFPDTYKESIRALKAEHPNWKIKAIYLNLDWNLAVDIETRVDLAKSRINNSYYSDKWKNVENSNVSNYNVGGYTLASGKAVSYTMDPRNFLNRYDIFQFLVLNYNPPYDSLNASAWALKNTPMAIRCTALRRILELYSTTVYKIY